MSIIPEFELGLWNAWILVLLMFFIVVGLSFLIIRLFFNGAKSQESSRRHSTTPPYTRFEKNLSHLSTVILLATLAYSVFLPLKLGTGWFYAGLVVYVLGLVFGFVAMINFAAAPLGKPATAGVYRVSRHPMYFSMFVMFMGIGIACSSWVFVLSAVIWLTLSDRGVVAEERLCLETYGETYRAYLERTPRWIGIPKSEKE